MRISVRETRSLPSNPSADRDDLGSTIFHITVHKAGSQWIRQILSKCAPDRIVQPQLRNAHLLHDPIKEGHIYPAVCITKKDFDRIRKPKRSRRFVILRDLRDILVSAYFSLKYSHPEEGKISEIRGALNARGTEEGLLWLLRKWLPGEAQIFSSWINGREDWIRYEDLLENDLGIMEAVLINRCDLDIDRALFREQVLSCRFERLTGRIPGQEDLDSHLRKGVAGDWKNHFTSRIKQAFKWRYGRLLVKSGYEKSNEW